MGALGLRPSRRDGTTRARHFSAGALPDIPIAVPKGRRTWVLLSQTSLRDSCRQSMPFPGTEVPGYSHSVRLGRAPERQSFFESRRQRRRYTLVHMFLNTVTYYRSLEMRKSARNEATVKPVEARILWNLSVAICYLLLANLRTVTR